MFRTHQYGTIKPLKYVKQDDTVFGVAHTSSAVCYPGQGNVRIRWNSAQIRPVEQEDVAKLRSMAVTGLAAETKNIKNILKNALTQPVLIRLISFQTIGKSGEQYVLKNEGGETIVLGNVPGMEETTNRIGLLPDGNLLKNQVLVGAFYYDAKERRLKLQPLSILTNTDVVRLLY